MTIAEADPADLARATSPRVVSFEGSASAGAALLTSPVSGQACVYWRVRIAQRLTDRSQLVHEIASDEAFEVRWGRGDDSNGAPAVRVRVEPNASIIHATPVLHREGTPGAEAAGQFFGLAGPVSVEETLVRAGESLTAEGVLSDLDSSVGAGLFRGTSRGPELLEAVLTLEQRSLGPALLPWALGTAAALMTGMGLTTWAVWRAHARLLPAAVVGAPRCYGPHVPHAQLQPPELPRPRLP
jgi:hypothetical protein